LALQSLNDHNRNLKTILDQLGPIPEDNIDTIVKIASELLQGSCAVYNRIDYRKKSLCTWSACNLPRDFKREHPLNNTILCETTIKNGGNPVIIENLAETIYAKTDPNVENCGFKSYLGFPVSLDRSVKGSLCVMDSRVRAFADEEVDIMTTLARALSVEESRMKADREKNYALQQARDRLKEERAQRKHLEKKLQESHSELKHLRARLHETHNALTVLTKKRDDDLALLEERLLRNVLEIVDPSIKKLKNTGLSAGQKKWLEILETNLNDITSPLAQRLSANYYKLTPMEIRIASMIKINKTNKEIAELMGISHRTIEVHRANIRKKFGLKNKKINLRTHLMSFD